MGWSKDWSELGYDTTDPDTVDQIIEDVHANGYVIDVVVECVNCGSYSVITEEDPTDGEITSYCGDCNHSWENLNAY